MCTNQVPDLQRVAILANELGEGFTRNKGPKNRGYVRWCQPVSCEDNHWTSYKYHHTHVELSHGSDLTQQRGWWKQRAVA
jgi:hypothetical protein